MISGRPHRFEPARLVFGVPLLAAGLAFVLDAQGVWQLPAGLLLAFLPLALLLGTLAAMVTSVARHAARRPRDPAGGG